MSAANVIRRARAHVGYVEGPGKDNIFGKWYGANHSPWCACFVSWALAAGGHPTLLKGAQTEKGFNSCGAGIKFFKAHNAWHPVAEAQAGDLAFFDWDHDGSQDHVGLVVEVDVKGKKVKCIEGNTSDKSHSNGGVVQEQWRNFSVIMGVGRPAYPDAVPVKPVAAPAVVKPVVAKPVVKPAVKPVVKTAEPELKAE
jgi:CHAP domain